MSKLSYTPSDKIFWIHACASSIAQQMDLVIATWYTLPHFQQMVLLVNFTYVLRFINI